MKQKSTWPSRKKLSLYFKRREEEASEGARFYDDFSKAYLIFFPWMRIWGGTVVVDQPVTLLEELRKSLMLCIAFASLVFITAVQPGHNHPHESEKSRVLLLRGAYWFNNPI